MLDRTDFFTQLAEEILLKFLHRLFLGVLNARQVIGKRVFVDDAQRFGVFPIIIGVDVVTHFETVIIIGSLTDKAVAILLRRIRRAAFLTRERFGNLPCLLALGKLRQIARLT